MFKITLLVWAAAAGPAFAASGVTMVNMSLDQPVEAPRYSG